jgi:hypothetical protein
MGYGQQPYYNTYQQQYYNPSLYQSAYNTFGYGGYGTPATAYQQATYNAYGTPIQYGTSMYGTPTAYGNYNSYYPTANYVPRTYM